MATLQRMPSEFGSDEKDEIDDECILMGYLRDEPNVPITVDGCPGNDTFQVIFNSQRIHDSTFVVHKGQVEAVHLDENQMSASVDDGNTIILDDNELPEEFRNDANRELLDRSLPSSFKMTLSLSYDNLFLNNVCGGNHATAKSRVEKIVSLAQTYFLDSTTLGTQITLDVKEIKHTNGEFKLRNSGVTCNTGCQLNRVSSEIAKVSQLDVDNWHVFSADNPGPGVLDTAGVARSVGLPGWTATGSVCIPMKEHRVGITEFFGNPNDWEGGKLKAALTFAHELGHSLGLPHDFVGSNTNNPRSDSSGNSCLNVDGIMSYKNTKTTWSTCSKEMINAWFKQVNAGMKCKKNSSTSTAVNCKWGAWTIGSCSKTCGGGSRTNTRSKLVTEANGGTCSGKATATEQCNTQACPSTGGGGCKDTDNGATDPWGDGCAMYAKYTSWCGNYDDKDFFSKKMCCVCGGGQK